MAILPEQRMKNKKNKKSQRAQGTTIKPVEAWLSCSIERIGPRGAQGANYRAKLRGL
ncbi:hypothetical protein PV326_000631, partial [Microctonus aethiopoides]